MPKPIPEATRRAITNDIRAGQKSRAAIARDHGVSPATVGNIAKQAGIEQPFDRTLTKRATESAQADLASRQSKLAGELLDDVDLLRRAARNRIGNMGDDPELRGMRNAYTALGIAVDKAVKLAEAQRGDDHSDVDGWLRHMLDGGGS